MLVYKVLCCYSGGKYPDADIRDHVICYCGDRVILCGSQ